MASHNLTIILAARGWLVGESQLILWNRRGFWGWNRGGKHWGKSPTAATVLLALRSLGFALSSMSTVWGWDPQWRGHKNQGATHGASFLAMRACQGLDLGTRATLFEPPGAISYQTDPKNCGTTPFAVSEEDSDDPNRLNPLYNKEINWVPPSTFYRSIIVWPYFLWQQLF